MSRPCSEFSSREPFDLDVVAREMQMPHPRQTCTARPHGSQVGDRQNASTQAANDLMRRSCRRPGGLRSPPSCTCKRVTDDEMLDLLIDCADRAERIRRRGVEVVLVAGAELSLSTRAFCRGHPRRTHRAAADPAKLRELMTAIAEPHQCLLLTGGRGPRAIRGQGGVRGDPVRARRLGAVRLRRSRDARSTRQPGERPIRYQEAVWTPGC